MMVLFSSGVLFLMNFLSTIQAFGGREAGGSIWLVGS